MGPADNGPRALSTVPRQKGAPSAQPRPELPQPPFGLAGSLAGRQKNQDDLPGTGQSDPGGLGYMPSQVELPDGRILCNLGIGQGIFVREYEGFQIFYMGFAHELMCEITKLDSGG